MKRFLFYFCLSAFSAMAEEPEKLVEALRAQVRVEAKALPQPANPADTRRTDLFRALGSVLSLLVSEDNFETNLSVDYLPAALTELQMISDSPKVQDLCNALQTELDRQAEDNSKANSRKVAAELREALLKGISAKSAKEVDAPLAQVIRLRTPALIRASSWGDKAIPSSVHDVEKALLDYQDALMAGQESIPKPGQDPVETLRHSVEYYSLKLAPLIPRSEFLEKFQAAFQRLPDSNTRRLTLEELDEKIKAIVARIQKPEEMADADQQITALMKRQYLNSFAATTFRKWYSSYQAVLKGSPLTRFDYFDLITHGPPTKIEIILRPLVLARVLDLPKDLAQKDGENVGDFVLRAFKTSCSKLDWPLAVRIAEFARLANLEILLSYNDEQAIYSLRSATNEDQAGFHARGVASYLTALKSGSQVIPVDYIGQRLQDIRQKYPKEYANGIELYQSYLQKVEEIQRRNGYPTFPKPNSSTPAKP